ncbi:MAG: phosphoenolpyruvate--protein phosphotransferase [Spirochaetales bacterium]|nr:phosphoenolpyruvate--protein phosphotransferase [Spirochaetales bacterium]
MKKKEKDMKQEARYLKSLKLNLDLLYIFLGERKGSEEERNHLKDIISEMGDEIYTEAVCLLTHTYPRNHAEAKKIIVDIIKHRNKMVDLLQRNVSIQVATLDYQENIRNILLEPEIIKIDRYSDLSKVTIINTATIAYDKRFFNIDLEKEVERTKRLNAHLSLMFIDIEEENNENGENGDESGLNFFHYVNRCINVILRKYDFVYGYGGNRFVILLPLTNEKEVGIVADRILNSIRTSRADFPGKKPDVNIGISSFKGENLINGNEVICSADDALAAAKKGGKNQIYLNVDNKINKSLTSFTGMKENKCITIKGRPLVHGYAVGNAFHYYDIETRHIEVRTISKDKIPGEMNRIREALKKVKEDYREMQSGIDSSKFAYKAEVFNVYISLLEDITLLEEIEKKLNSDLLNAEQVVKSVFHQLVYKFRLSDSLLIQEKALDIEDIGKRLLRKLTGIEENILSYIPESSIIFATRLLPSDIVHLRQRNVSAIITEQGGDTSYSALVARDLGIPAVSNIVLNERDVPEGVEVLINGYEGLVIVYPDTLMKDKILKKIEKTKLDSIKIRKETKKMRLQIADEKIFVDANISAHTDTKEVISCGCDNIGLFRIEPLYMHYSSLPTEAQLFSDLSSLLKDYKKKQITIRLADFGGDIIPPYIRSSDKHRSLLGLRGVRFLFEYPEILTDQLRVCLQLSAYFHIKILIPMVTVFEDVMIVRDLLETQKELFLKKRIRYNPDIQLGSMIELPSALMTFNEILQQSDFISLGTNDLIQYTMAADRQLIEVSTYFERGYSIILPHLKDIFRKAKEADTGINLSGELAGNTRFTGELLDAGLRNFSVAPFFIPMLKDKIHSILSNR